MIDPRARDERLFARLAFGLSGSLPELVLAWRNW